MEMHGSTRPHDIHFIHGGTHKPESWLESLFGKFLVSVLEPFLDQRTLLVCQLSQPLPHCCIRGGANQGSAIGVIKGGVLITDNQDICSNIYMHLPAYICLLLYTPSPSQQYNASIVPSTACLKALSRSDTSLATEPRTSICTKACTCYVTYVICLHR